MELVIIGWCFVIALGEVVLEVSVSVDDVDLLGSQGKGSGESSVSSCSSSSSSSVLRCCFFNNNMLNSTAISHDEYVVAADDFIGLLLKLFPLSHFLNFSLILLTLLAKESSS